MTNKSDLDINRNIYLITGEIVDILNVSEQSVTGSGGGGGGKIDTDVAFFTDMRVHGEIKIDEIKIESSTKHIQKVFLKASNNKEHVINVDMNQMVLRKGHKIKIVSLDAHFEADGMSAESILAIFNQDTDGAYIDQAKIKKLTVVADSTPQRAFFGPIAVVIIGVFIALRYFWSSNLMIKALILAPFIYAAYRIMNYYFSDKGGAYSTHIEEADERARALKAYLSRVEKQTLN